MKLEEIPIKFHKEQILSLLRRVDCGRCRLTNMKEFKDVLWRKGFVIQTLTFDVVYNNIEIGDLIVLIDKRYFEVSFRKTSKAIFKESWSRNYWPMKFKGRRHKLISYQRPSFKSWGLQCKKEIKITYETKMDIEINHIMET